MKTPWLLPVVTLTVGAATGYLVGSDTQQPAVQPAATKDAQRSERRGGKPAGGDAGASTASRVRGRDVADIYREPSQMNRIQGLIDRYAGLSGEQFGAEADKLNNLPMSDRIIAAYLLFSKWAEVDPNAAMAHTDKMGFTGMFVKPTVLQSWASVDPVNAAAYFDKNPREFAMMGMMGGPGGPGFGRGRGGGGAASIIAGEWAKQDPDAALAWAQNLKGGENRGAVSSVLEQVAQNDPKKAASMLPGIDERERANASAAIAREWAVKDWGGAEAWINGLPAEERDDAFSSAVRGLAATDPQLAASKFAALPEGRSRDQAAEEIATALGRDNPRAGIDWVMSNGSQDAQQEAIRPLMMNLARSNDGGARQVIDTLPAGEVRDRAVSTYVFSNISSNPKEVISVAETIADERSRERTLQMSAARWLSEDRPAAEQYIQNSTTFDAETKQRLLSGEEQGGGWRDRMRR